MDSPPGSPLLEEEDVSIPCKGCGNVLEEGKAFELAGNRWHIECFRCNSCGTLLDSDANLLLLGDGSLICNSCTYSCTACNNKIEDLAILTGDQAFCANCFRCRNCKRKIENLKYARTSQGIFCMSCHETLMTRRKKRPKPNQSQRTPTIPSTTPSPMLSLDKSLPSLPVDDETVATTPTEQRSRLPPDRSNSTKSSSAGQLSPMPTSGVVGDNLRTPRSQAKRHSQIPSEPGQPADYSFIPLVLDNPSASSPAQLPNTAYNRPGLDRGSSDSQFNRVDRPMYDRKSSNASSLYESERERSARPHIATQDRSYEPQAGISKNDISQRSHEPERVSEKLTASTDLSYLRSQEPEMGSSLGKSATADANTGSFKLKDVPRERKKSIGAPRPLDYDVDEAQDNAGSLSPSGTRTDHGPVNANSLPPRGDSFKPPKLRMDFSTLGKNKSPGLAEPMSARQMAASVEPSAGLDPKLAEILRKGSSSDNSSFSPNSESALSPSLAPYRSQFSPQGYAEDMKKRFPPAKHGRSLSEVAKQATTWPGNETHVPPYGEAFNATKDEEIAALRIELRRAFQTIAELQAQQDSTESAKALENNILEKRHTVALLETEREAFLRELMVIRDRLDTSNDGRSLDPEQLKGDLVRELTRGLEECKQTLKSDIHELVSQRDQLLEDVENFGRLREQSIMETEQLNQKNAQLADLNNELTRRIEDQIKAGRGDISGLGIFDSDLLDSLRGVEKRPGTAVTGTTIGVPYNETPETTEVLVAQKVATYKNGAQQKKFFWKKPGSTIMKGAGKLNRVFAPENQIDGTNYPDSPHLRIQGGQGGPDTSGGKLFGAAPKKWMKNNKAGTNGIGVNGSTNGSNGGGFSHDNPIPIFGTDLEVRTAFEGVRIPAVVQKCIQEVEMRGMDYEGIYRKSGGTNQMRLIQEEFERGDDVQFDPNLDICSVTSVLKQYFRNLPNPLITHEVYDRFVDTSSIYDEDKRIDALKAIRDDLPAAHRDVLQFVIFHLARVAARKEENLMNTRNLAVVFAPTLIRHLSDEREMSDMHTRNNAIQFLIDYNEDIF